MPIKEELFLSDKPLGRSNTSISLDVFSVATLLGSVPKWLAEKRVLEGTITADPERCLLYALQPAEFHPGVASAPPLWDAYLLVLPFTLHEAPGNRYYKKMAFLLEFTTQQTTILDVFPRQIHESRETSKAYTLSPENRIVEVSGGETQAHRQFRYETLQPTIRAYEKDRGSFYWIYDGSNQEKEVSPGTRYVLVVLRVPHGTHVLAGTISYEIELAKALLGMWETREALTDRFSLLLDLRNAIPFWDAPGGKTNPLANLKGVSRFDVCVVCALKKEADAFIEIVEKACEVVFKRDFSKYSNNDYYFTTIKNNRGEEITLRVSWLPRYGPLETALHIYPVFCECQPRFAAMTGFCAGDKKAVKLGDLVIAERAFLYDSGKWKITEEGYSKKEADVYTFELSSALLSFVRGFDGWKALVSGVAWPVSADPTLELSTPVDHIETIASGSSVRGDSPFDDVRSQVRKAIALDMEGAAFYRTAEEFPGLNALLVKGIADYADSSKDDRYHDYASRVSAAYMLSFIKEYVTTERLPRQS